MVFEQDAPVKLWQSTFSFEIFPNKAVLPVVATRFRIAKLCYTYRCMKPFQSDLLPQKDSLPFIYMLGYNSCHLLTLNSRGIALLNM